LRVEDGGKLTPIFRFDQRLKLQFVNMRQHWASLWHNSHSTNLAATPPKSIEIKCMMPLFESLSSALESKYQRSAPAAPKHGNPCHP
jgi:hypothetical protein